MSPSNSRIDCEARELLCDPSKGVKTNIARALSTVGAGESQDSIRRVRDPIDSGASSPSLNGKYWTDGKAGRSACTSSKKRGVDEQPKKKWRV
jgi:hypothetical protein